MSIAASPVDEGADPPDWSNTRIPVAMPDATSDTRMLSMLVCVSAVLLNAAVKLPPFILSKALAGKLVRLEQSFQVAKKLSPTDVSIRGKLVRLEQPCQAWLKRSPEDVSMSGKLVRLKQPNQAWLKLVPEDVSIKGKLVRLLQPNQVRLKLVPDEVLIRGKEVSSDQALQNSVKSVTAP